jgi:MYXO-CTERM domain-containing protein
MYTVLDLGTLGGESYASGVNNLGQVVGYCFGANNSCHMFRTGPNQPINPATDDLGSFDSNNANYGNIAYGINDLGQVVGYTSAPNGDIHAFRTNSPISLLSSDLGTGAPLGPAEPSFAQACCINDKGQAAGDFLGSNGYEAFRTPSGRAMDPNLDDLGSLAGRKTMAFGINNSGQVVGYSQLQGQDHAYRTLPNQAINPATDDLGTLGGQNSKAYGINELGQVVGGAQDANGNAHAFRTAPNQPINAKTDDLGVLPGYELSVAAAINNLGQVVGGCDETAFTPIGSYPTAQEEPFIYGNGVMKDLNGLIDPNSGWRLVDAQGINDLGQIVGYGYYKGGMQEAYLLTPVPEPAVVALLVLGGLAALRRRA